jgi:hypothetical protein
MPAMLDTISASCGLKVITAMRKLAMEYGFSRKYFPKKYINTFNGMKKFNKKKDLNIVTSNPKYSIAVTLSQKCKSILA